MKVCFTLTACTTVSVCDIQLQTYLYKPLRFYVNISLLCKQLQSLVVKCYFFWSSNLTVPNRLIVVLSLTVRAANPCLPLAFPYVSKCTFEWQTSFSHKQIGGANCLFTLTIATLSFFTPIQLVIVQARFSRLHIHSHGDASSIYQTVTSFTFLSLILFYILCDFQAIMYLFLLF